MNQAASRLRGEEGGLMATTNLFPLPLLPAGYARYLLFCSFGDAFINQMPSSRLVRPRHFSSPSDNIRHAAAGGRCTPLFSSIPAFLTFLLPRELPPSHPVPSHPVSSPRFPHRAPHTNVSRWSGESESDGISSKITRASGKFASLWGKFASLRKYYFTRGYSVILNLHVSGVHTWSKRLVDIYGKSKFLIHDRSVSERFRGWKLFSYVCSVKYLYPFSFRYLISLLY